MGINIKYMSDIEKEKSKDFIILDNEDINKLKDIINKKDIKILIIYIKRYDTEDSNFYIANIT